MDPDACLSELLGAIASDESQAARDHAESLLTWLDRGGFSPGGTKLRLSAIRGFCNWVVTTYPREE